MEYFLEMICDLLGPPLLWIVLLPVSYVVSTPIILMIASLPSAPPDYGQRVAEMYRSVFEFWLELGTYF